MLGFTLWCQKSGSIVYNECKYEMRCQMKNIFDVLPLNFFSIFQGDNRRQASDCINVLFSHANTNIEYTLLREVAVDILEEYYKTNDTRNIKNTPRESANHMLMRLKDCDWIDNEIQINNNNYENRVVFQEGAIAFMQFKEDLSEEEEIEYSGYMYVIRRDLAEYRHDVMMDSIDSAYHSTVNLFERLKTLNTGMKRFHQKLFDEHIRNDINQLIGLLTADYQVKVVDRAYYNLTTKDNPSKYTRDILQSYHNIRGDEYMMESIITKAIDRKDLSYLEAESMYIYRLNYIHEMFSQIEEIIREINFKNAKFVSTSMSRINFMLSSDKDVEGILNGTIKKLGSLNQSDLVEVEISRINFLDTTSLAKPRFYQVKTPYIMSAPPKFPDSLYDHMDRLLLERENTQQKIAETVMTALEDRDRISINEVSNRDISFAVLVYIYGHSFDSPYRIEEKNNERIVFDAFSFTDFWLVRS